MDLKFEVSNVVVDHDIHGTSFRLPFILHMVLRESGNTHDVALLFNERIGRRIIEHIEREIARTP